MGPIFAIKRIVKFWSILHERQQHVMVFRESAARLAPQLWHLATQLLSYSATRCLSFFLCEMRTEIFHHAASLLSKYSEYSEADLSHVVTKLLNQKANLTEALGVNAQFGGLMQATYDEMMESGVYELKSGGFLVFIAYVLHVL